MTRENVELVQAYAREAAKGERDGLLPFYAPDIVWYLDASHPDQRVLRGREEVADYFLGWSSPFEGIRTEVEQYIEHGEHVVVPFVAYGRPRGSSAEVRLAETWTFRVRHGVIVEVREYLDTGAALEDLGLPQQHDAADQPATGR
jgi:ketosteroid isomerase-like protein